MTRPSVDRLGDDLLTSMHEIVALVTFLFITCTLGMGVKLGREWIAPRCPAAAAASRHWVRREFTGAGRTVSRIVSMSSPGASHYTRSPRFFWPSASTHGSMPAGATVNGECGATPPLMPGGWTAS